MNMGKLVAISVPWWLVFTEVANALPLQPGSYSWGSKYIQIAKKGDRFCYQGFSARATLIASLSPHPKYPNLHQIAGSKEMVVRQDSPDQLSYGSVNHLLPYPRDRQFGSELTAEMKQCLNAQKPYYKQKTSTR
ncbi:MAG: hypothetical protein IGS48_05480 [Oscillatoriales cyanobacterium C42_A2020_001]|nr:hypothetical protein [Leptolyngbyaceae cyanobacterium C42_A2020_001]